MKKNKKLAKFRTLVGALVISAFSSFAFAGGLKGPPDCVLWLENNEWVITYAQADLVMITMNGCTTYTVNCWQEDGPAATEDNENGCFVCAS